MDLGHEIPRHLVGLHKERLRISHGNNLEGGTDPILIPIAIDNPSSGVLFRQNNCTHGRHAAVAHRLTLSVLALLASVGMADSAYSGIEAYRCSQDLVSGLHFNREAKLWQPQSFAAGKPYVLRKLTDDDARGKWSNLFVDTPGSTIKPNFPKADWVFIREGEYPTAFCWSNQMFGDWKCRPFGATFFDFDVDTRRFELAIIGGYLSQGWALHFQREHPTYYEDLLKKSPDSRMNPDDETISIGTCKAD